MQCAPLCGTAYHLSRQVLPCRALMNSYPRSAPYSGAAFRSRAELIILSLEPKSLHSTMTCRTEYTSTSCKKVYISERLGCVCSSRSSVGTTLHCTVQCARVWVCVHARYPVAERLNPERPAPGSLYQGRDDYSEVESRRPLGAGNERLDQMAAGYGYFGLAVWRPDHIGGATAHA
jgi:hypothetical protein